MNFTEKQKRKIEKVINLHHKCKTTTNHFLYEFETLIENNKEWCKEMIEIFVNLEAIQYNASYDIDDLIKELKDFKQWLKKKEKGL